MTYEVRDDVVSGPALAIPAHRSPTLTPLPHGTRALAIASIGSADAMTILEAWREACRLIAK